MHSVVSHILFALITVHAALGSSLHVPACLETGTALCHDDHADHGHHENPAGDHGAPPKCEEQCCTYLSSRTVVPCVIDLFGLAAPWLTEQYYRPSSGPAYCGRSTADDVTHPAGPALHIWQCVWVI